MVDISNKNLTKKSRSIRPHGKIAKADYCVIEVNGGIFPEENLKSHLLCAISDLSRVNPPNFIKELQKAENGSVSLKQRRGLKLGSNSVASGCSCVHQRGFVCF